MEQEFMYYGKFMNQVFFILLLWKKQYLQRSIRNALDLYYKIVEKKFWSLK